MEKIKVLVNASTLVVGGGVQVGKSFIEYVIDNPPDDISFRFFLSKQIYEQLTKDRQASSLLAVAEISPARPLRGAQARKAIKEMERSFSPDVVYSLGFPSYIRFIGKEIGRYTNPWEINLPPLPWETLSLRQRIVTYLGIKYRLWWASKTSFFETQTEAARAGIVKTLGVQSSSVYVIPNSCNKIFHEAAGGEKVKPLSREKVVKLFCLAAPYKHKNLEIIPSVAKVLKDNGYRVKFIVTAPDNSDVWSSISINATRIGVDDSIENVGVLGLNECLHYYKESDIVFLPTLLEVFSATYLEAMAMGKPIVTTDFEFSRAICGAAALYFEAKNPDSAAAQISSLIDDIVLYGRVVESGKQVLNTYPDIDEKYGKVFSMLRSVAKK